MKRLSILIVMLLQMVFAMAQNSITVRFTAQDQNGNYCQLNTIGVSNNTQNWNLGLEYPDTTLVLNYTDGVVETSVADGFIYNRPNPFHGTTEAMLNLSMSGQTHIQLVNTNGIVLAECDANLSQGEHVIKVSLAEPQLALLCARTDAGFYALKILNIGPGARNSVEVVSSLKSTKSRETRAEGELFELGDEMSYFGMMLQNGAMVMSTNTVSHAQYSDELITFVFNMNLPVVTTGEVSGITSTTAVCGGEVISDGGAAVTARGVCWATTPNPTISDSHTTDGSGLGGFVSNLSNLAPETLYYVRAYATNSAGTAYGEAKSFTTDYFVPEGAVRGQFSISRTERVYFSQGNLQYQASTGTLRFAEHQWDFVGSQTPRYGDPCGTVEGSDNHDMSVTYSGWIDLFSWGSGDNPISASCVSSFSDWGSKPISNGGNLPDQWRTLAKAEWEYLLFNRHTESGNLFIRAKVNDVKGLILLPDDWQTSFYTFSSVNNLSDIDISLADWTNEIEPHGAVFLPAAGYQYPFMIQGVEYYPSSYTNRANYWSSTPKESPYSEEYAYSMQFGYPSGYGDFYLSAESSKMRHDGYAVRLVSSATVHHEDLLPVVTTSQQTAAVSCVKVNCVGNLVSAGGSEVTSRGFIFSSTSDNPPYMKDGAYPFFINGWPYNNYSEENNGSLGVFTRSFGVSYNYGTTYVRAYATNSAGTAFGEVIQIAMPAGPCGPYVETEYSTDITTTSAVCAGYDYFIGSYSENYPNLTERGVYYSKTNPEPTAADNRVVSTDAFQYMDFTCQLTGLQSNTTYYWRAYATDNNGTGYGDVKQFTTLPVYSVPTVVTNAPSEVTYYYVTCGGTVTNDGAMTVTSRGVCYSTTNTMPTIEDSHVSSVSGLSTFTCSIYSLQPNTTYYYRAYATNEMGTGYGEVMTFHTVSLPTVTTTIASSITTNSAISGGNVTSQGSSAVTSRGVCYGLNSYPTVDEDICVSSGSGTGAFTSTLTGLQPNTLYYYRAYATNSYGTAYGQYYTFITTSTGALPTVTTTVASNITSSSAVSGGNVTSQGNSAVTSRGVCYSTTNSTPTISNSTVTSGSGTGSFTTTLSGLSPGTTYYYRAYATNSAGTGYGQVYTLTTSGGTPSDPNALPGQFSVSSTRKVYFSKGNLQYKASTATWRFATNQYDIIGSDNSNISSTYSGWIDLFGWGTSGYNGCLPYQTSLSVVYGGNLSSIANTNYDWGVYNMSGYRTLTDTEWDYLRSERDNAGALFAPATVNNVCGWILLPDSWSSSPYTFVSFEDGARYYTDNVYTATQWSAMQSAGAVFLPAVGWRYSSGSSSMTTYVNSDGYYWTTTSRKALHFARNFIGCETVANHSGCAVRLVRNAQ